jgi:LPS-assembly protein
MIKINAHSIYNDEYYDIKRWSGSGEIGKIIDYNNYIFEANANLGLDLYSIQGRPSTDTDNNRYIERISSGLSMSVSKQHYINYDSFGLLLEPKIQYSTIISPDRTDEIPNRDSAEFRLDQANLFFNNQYQGRDNIQKNARINTGFTSLIMSEKFGNLEFFIGQSQKMSGTEKNITTKSQDRQSHIINSIDWSLSEAVNFSWFSLYNHHNIKSDLSSFTFNGSKDDWSYSANHNSILNEFISDSSDREELKLSLSKNFAEWKTSYSTTYDMNDNKQNRISESLGIEYTGSGYMFQNCLTILLQYKNNGGVVDRDILPENSIYLTFNFRNLGDYTYMPNLPKI